MRATLTSDGTPSGGGWIQTHSGRAFYFDRPTADMICVGDIATALSRIPRFGGHTSRMYSVAEHSINVSHLVPREHAMTALLHDATEAYLGDMMSPLKARLPDFKRLEFRAWLAIAERFGLPIELPESVKSADIACLFAERNELMGEPAVPWEWEAEPADIPILCLHPREAREEFLSRFTALGGRLA